MIDEDRVVTDGQGTGEQRAAGMTGSLDTEHPRDYVKREMLSRFAAWIDDVLASEPPLPGVDPTLAGPDDARSSTAAAPAHTAGEGISSRSYDGVDLYSLWSSMVSQAQETRLQGREFKQLREDLASIAAMVDPLNETVESHRRITELLGRIAGDVERNNTAADDAARTAAWGEVIDLLLDLRDRFARGCRTADAVLSAGDRSGKRGWLSRLLGRSSDTAARDAAAALRDGARLCLDRVDAALAQHAVTEIECSGRLFDPACMKAVDVEHVAGVDDGTVLAVYRTGYRRNGEVYRPAEVKVAKNETAERDRANCREDTTENEKRSDHA